MGIMPFFSALSWFSGRSFVWRCESERSIGCGFCTYKHTNKRKPAQAESDLTTQVTADVFPPWYCVNRPANCQSLHTCRWSVNRVHLTLSTRLLNRLFPMEAVRVHLVFHTLLLPQGLFSVKETTTHCHNVVYCNLSELDSSNFRTR